MALNCNKEEISGSNSSATVNEKQFCKTDAQSCKPPLLPKPKNLHVRQRYTRTRVTQLNERKNNKEISLTSSIQKGKNIVNAVPVINKISEFNVHTTNIIPKKRQPSLENKFDSHRIKFVDDNSATQPFKIIVNVDDCNENTHIACHITEATLDTVNQKSTEEHESSYTSHTISDSEYTHVHRNVSQDGSALSFKNQASDESCGVSNTDVNNDKCDNCKYQNSLLISKVLVDLHSNNKELLKSKCRCNFDNTKDDNLNCQGDSDLNVTYTEDKNLENVHELSKTKEISTEYVQLRSAASYNESIQNRNCVSCNNNDPNTSELLSNVRKKTSVSCEQQTFHKVETSEAHGTQLSDPTAAEFGKECSPFSRLRSSSFISIFNSFGKGKRSKSCPSSHFYYNYENNFERGVHFTECKPEKDTGNVFLFVPGQNVSWQDENLESYNLNMDSDVQLSPYDIHDVNRPASGLSEALEGLDMDVKEEDIPSLDETFEDEHSDSENENCQLHHNVTLKQRKERKAFYVAQELMTSERIFVDVLNLLCIDFINAVKHAEDSHQTTFIPDVDLSKIINFLPQLKHLNEDLLHDLEERIKNWSINPKISDVIVKKGPFLKLYTSYIQNFQSQCNFLDETCHKYPRFYQILKDFEASTRCQRLTLKHYMLKPIQRIPQYRLLLDDYLQCLEEDSVDYEDTNLALKIVSEVAEHANRSIKLEDNFQKLLQLQSQLGEYEIIKPGRELIKDGELFKLSRKVMQPRYFILLNDCLLYTSYYGPSVPTSGLRVSCEIPLTEMKISIPQAEDYQNEFSVISTKRSFRLCAQSPKERESWVKALCSAIKENESKQLTFKSRTFSKELYKGADIPEHFNLGREAPVWIQDQRVTRCQSCMKEFTVTFRRHHCRACGKVMCGMCSDNRAPLQYKKFHSARVCRDCFSYLMEEFQDPHSSINMELKSCMLPDDDFENFKKDVMSRFKKSDMNLPKRVKYIPQRLLEVTANDTGSQMSGWLQRRVRHSWKRLWFVLKEQVLYVYKASEDVVALESIPVLGYTVVTLSKRHSSVQDSVDPKVTFHLTHCGQPPLIFQADSDSLANRWIAAFQEATVLK